MHLHAVVATMPYSINCIHSVSPVNTSGSEQTPDMAKLARTVAYALTTNSATLKAAAKGLLVGIVASQVTYNDPFLAMVFLNSILRIAPDTTGAIVNSLQRVTFRFHLGERSLFSVLRNFLTAKSPALSTERVWS